MTLWATERRKIFNTELVHDAFANYCRRGCDHNIAVGRDVLMPDHTHFFIQGNPNFDLGVWIRGLKRVVAAAVAGGRVSHSVKTRALSFQSRSDERSLVH